MKCRKEMLSAVLFPAQKFEQISGTPRLLQHGSWFLPSTRHDTMSHVHVAQIIKSVICKFRISTGSQNELIHLQNDCKNLSITTDDILNNDIFKYRCSQERSYPSWIIRELLEFLWWFRQHVLVSGIFLVRAESISSISDE